MDKLDDINFCGWGNIEMWLKIKVKMWLKGDENLKLINYKFFGKKYGDLK